MLPANQPTFCPEEGISLRNICHLTECHVIITHYENLPLLEIQQCILTMFQNDDQFNDGAERPLLEAHGVPENGRTDSIEATEHSTFKRNLGVSEAFAIVISIVIGSGVFTSTGSIDFNVPSPGVALVIWLVGGVLAWTGASTLAELGTAIPGEGLCCLILFME